MNHYKFSIFLALWIVLCSCNTAKYLQANEVLLKSNKMQIEGNKSLENKIQISQELSTLYKQKPNGNFLLLFPREWLYYKAINKKHKNSFFTKTLVSISEPPALLDTNLCIATQNNIINYLYNQGFLNVACNYQVITKNKSASVSYIVNPGERYYINDIQFLADDKIVEDLVNTNLDASYLKPGDPLDNNLFQNEKARISELLYNNGFIEFNPIYIQTLEADTIHLKANIKLKIVNPEGKTSHPQYSVNKIEVNPIYLPGDSLEYVNKEFDSISFSILPYYKFVRLRPIAAKIKFRPGMIANKSLVDATYEQLSKLGIYRFVNIETKIDSIEKLKINYSIQLSPLKKWVLDFGADFNYTSIKTTGGKTLFGISGFVNLKNRNLFKGAESFSTKIEVGTELNLFNKDAGKFNSFNVHYSNELSLPSFYDITGSWALSGLILKPFTKLPTRPDSRTNIRVGADYENLVKFYNYTSLNANIEYDWQINRRKRLSLHTFGFSFYLPQTTESFDELLATIPSFEKSFKGKRLFTSYLVDNFTYYYQSKIKNNIQHSFIGNFNLSGFEVNAVNNLYNSISGSHDTFSLGEFEFSKFIKAEFDYRFYYSFSDKSKLASRFTFGIISPFGSSNSVPYIKQFYVGGPQSIRGWNIRELGPGSQLPSTSEIGLNTFFAAGDIKIEANLEYRFDIVWRLKGAMFLDAGNIWLLPYSGNKDKLGVFSNTFYKEIAIGTGVGVRVDLSYFLFRVDVGFKLRSPYIVTETGTHWFYNEIHPVSVDNLFKNSTIHLALDYPF